MSTHNIFDSLFSFADEKYKLFQSSLMPGVEKERIIGIRTPILRKYAAKICGSAEANFFINTLPHYYYEENNLHGMLIERMDDYCEVIRHLDKFLPYVNNWATCDLISPKVFKNNTEKLYIKICQWINSEKPYIVRFGIKTLMNFYLDNDFSPKHLELIAGIASPHYYVNMARAWYFATALAKQYDSAVPYLEKRYLEVWTHNKTIQKAIESYRIDSEKKEYLKTLRIKNNGLG